MGKSMGWQMPTDRPAVTKEPRNPRRPNEAHEEFQLSDVVDWLKGDDKTFSKMRCVLLENMVEGLIFGGRYLYGWANGEGGDAPEGQGMPELDVLQECNINCMVVRGSQKSKGMEVPVTLRTTSEEFFLGYDADEETQTPRTIGPRQSGPPPDVFLKVSPEWVLEFSQRQREMALFNALLCIVPDERTNMTQWKVISPDIVINSATIEIYGIESAGAQAAVNASQRHIQTALPGMTPEAKKIALGRLLAEQGLTYKDGRIILPDGTVHEV